MTFKFGFSSRKSCSKFVFQDKSLLFLYIISSKIGEKYSNENINLFDTLMISFIAWFIKFGAMWIKT